MNTLQNEMQRYLQVIERAEADPEVWGKLTEGTGIATANSYRAALAAAQPVAPEQADPVVGYSPKQREMFVKMIGMAREGKFGIDHATEQDAFIFSYTADELLASLSAKGEAPKEKYGAVVRAEDGAPYDALAELIKRGIKLARLRADIKSDVEDAFYSQTVAIEIDGVRTTAVTHERFNRMLNVLYDRWLPRSTPAAPEGTVSAPVDLRAVLLAYEQWEADVIADNACWGAEGMSPYPILCDGHWDRFIEIQSMRNEALGTWSKAAPVTNSVDSSLSVKDANQNAGEDREGAEIAQGLKDSFPTEYLTDRQTDALNDAIEYLSAAPSGVVEAREKVMGYLNGILAMRGIREITTLKSEDALNRIYIFAEEAIKALVAAPKGSTWETYLKEEVWNAPAAPKEGEQPARIGKLDWRTADGRYPPKEDENPVQYIQRLCRHIVNVECSNRGWNDAYGRLEESREKITGELRDLAKAKPNPELLVAAALHSLLKRHHQRSKDKFHGYESSKLGTETAAALTQWEASQPSPDSPKNQ